jgi:hypothetical protein
MRLAASETSNSRRGRRKEIKIEKLSVFVVLEDNRSSATEKALRQFPPSLSSRY